MGLVILDKSPAFNLKEYFNKYKTFIKFLLGQKRGPDAVIRSLLNGLKELNFVYKYNVKVKDIKPDDVVYINGSVEALKWAIEAKKAKIIKKIIVGPVMVVLPNEKEGIICNENIDKIIVPSSWVKDLWLSIKPELTNRITVWPAGADLYPINNQKKDKILVYQKNADTKLFKDAVNFLKSNNIQYEIIKYGFYNHKKYLELLDKSKAVIYLSQSESQGLAMCEAWMKNVPTFVWNRGCWEYQNVVWKDEKISAPYLTDRCGMFFKDFNDFKNKWSEFMISMDIFTPREYAENNFSNKHTAENFLKIIQ